MDFGTIGLTAPILLWLTQGYTQLRNRVGSIGEAQLRPDMRSVLLNVAYDTFGKGGGMTKACIAKVFKHTGPNARGC